VRLVSSRLPRYNAGLHRIERLMRQEGLRARPRRRGLPKDGGQRHAVSPNILDRAFVASAPNQKWIADFTYIWTAQGWLYVAAVVDLYSRRVVGWSMSSSMAAQLVTDALIMAIWRRGKPDSLLHHSDQGSQGRCVRLYRALLQPEAPTLDTGLSQPRAIRRAS
jgi:putative transposase